MPGEWFLLARCLSGLCSGRHFVAAPTVPLSAVTAKTIGDIASTTVVSSSSCRRRRVVVVESSSSYRRRRIVVVVSSSEQLRVKVSCRHYPGKKRLTTFGGNDISRNIFIGISFKKVAAHDFDFYSFESFFIETSKANFSKLW